MAGRRSLAAHPGFPEACPEADMVMSGSLSSDEEADLQARRQSCMLTCHAVRCCHLPHGQEFQILCQLSAPHHPPSLCIGAEGKGPRRACSDCMRRMRAGMAVAAAATGSSV